MTTKAEIEPRPVAPWFGWDAGDGRGFRCIGCDAKLYRTNRNEGVCIDCAVEFLIAKEQARVTGDGYTRLQPNS